LHQNLALIRRIRVGRPTWLPGTEPTSPTTPEAAAAHPALAPQEQRC
jgi:hypothetical protein